ncbi:predicted protein [Scheffersomyces stipitis CBS 6054]|uniref:RING-type E3 ubiquitin transferase n=1 Tax=Scheffersomyces stipitis (strain ATCC 58785 / CBS 6054 / NBRC 10063 / NRRL Y-11545) TaxID=322104 RepID=A3LSS0_PICST|nr:predicted protein [Scheffersomyces stipitis CBS 6054]ABN65941.2 predicted protein [Scheffersomyces stipitis CBS 6054]
MSQVNERALPFADAATIVRAHQKDAYFESSYRSQLSDVIQLFKGQRFVNTYPEEITVFAKSAYLALTTLIGARTLGEEYVDLIYVSRSGKRLPKLLPRIGFIMSYALLPYLVSKLVRKLKPAVVDESGKDSRSVLTKFLSSYTKVLDSLMNLHIAIFYFFGEFYSLSKRVFGLRYAFGHNRNANNLNRAGNYSLLGAIILLQFAVKGLIKLKTINDDKRNPQQITEIDTLREVNEDYGDKFVIDLSNPSHLPYLPEGSRACMLCLSPMTNPAAANCGHMFCWDCIVGWIREHPECPLCRQSCLEQNLLPLR